MNFSKLLRRTWSAQDISRYAGRIVSSHLAWSSDAEIRLEAASGGIATALVLDSLERNLIDAALLCRSVIENGNIRAQFFLAKTREDVLSARGSKYVRVQFAKDALPLLREFKGRAAVIALPCDISVLSKAALSDKSLADKIIWTAALACGHNSAEPLIDALKSSLEKKFKSPVIRWKFRSGLWRGRMRAEFQNGKVFTAPSSFYNLYQNHYFFSEKKCLSCRDHFGYDADFSLGDVWEFSLKNRTIKPSGVLVKTDRAEEIFNDCIESGKIISESCTPSFILDGQARVLPCHYQAEARRITGKLLGVHIPAPDARDMMEKLPIAWHEYLNAFFIVLNWKISQTEIFKKYFLSVPRIFFKAYLYFLKFLQSLARG